MEGARRLKGSTGFHPDRGREGRPTPLRPPGLDSLAARHDLAIEVGPAASWEFDPSSGEVRWSTSVEEVLGYPPGTEGFRCWSEGLEDAPPDDDPGARLIADLGSSVIEPILAVVREGAAWEEYDLVETVQGPEGEMHQIRVRAVPVSMAGAQGCAGVVADVTERNEMGRALQDLIDRYRLLVDLSPDGIVVHQDGLVVYGNQSALRMFKLRSMDDGFGRSILDFLHPDSVEETLARIADLDEPGAVSPAGEALVVAVDGSETLVEATSVLTSWGGRPAYQVILRDVSERRQAEAVMRYQASLVAHVSDAIIGIDTMGRVESWNPAAEAIYGWSQAEAVGRPVTELLTAGSEHGPILEDGERVHVNRGGERIDVWVSLSPLYDDRGQPAGWVAVCTEITEARRAEAARKAAEERYAAVVAALEEGIIVVDADGTLTGANHAARKMLGSRLGTGTGDAIFSGDMPVTREDGSAYLPAECPIAATLRTGRPQTNVVLGVIDDAGERQWLSISARLLSNDQAQTANAVVCSFSDVTERKAAEAQLNWQANHDHLTGLANRAYFVRSVERGLAAARHLRHNVALLYIDLDRFKMVNDSLGHATGDEVLSTVGHRLESAARVGDVVSRLAGDEFAVLCRNISSAEAAVNLAQSLLQILSQPFSLPEKREMIVTASIGVAFVAEGEREANELIQDADAAMFRAKEKGRARVEVFDESLRRRAMTRLTVHEDLLNGIERGEFSLQYQPLASVSDDEVLGMEALVRWDHPSRGLLPPAEFIPVAEESDLIVKLGRWVLNDACATMANWKQSVPATKQAFVSVNLSARQLTDPDLVNQITGALKRSGLAAEALVLEVTESTLMADPAAASGVLADIRNMGVRLAIDDFGTGYSSLAHLKRFAVDFLKVDHSFIDGLGRDSEDEAIVAAVVELGHTLDLTVVAEGVETPRQLDKVRRLGCDLYQGYLLARPAPPSRVRFAEPGANAGLQLRSG